MSVRKVFGNPSSSRLRLRIEVAADRAKASSGRLSSKVRFKGYRVELQALVQPHRYSTTPFPDRFSAIVDRVMTC